MCCVENKKFTTMRTFISVLMTEVMEDLRTLVHLTSFQPWPCYQKLKSNKYLEWLRLGNLNTFFLADVKL